MTEVFKDEPASLAKKVDEVNQVFQVPPVLQASQVSTDNQAIVVYQVQLVIPSEVIQVHQVGQVNPVSQASVRTDDQVNEVQQVIEVQWVQPELKDQSVHQAFAIHPNVSQADSTDHQPLVKKVILKKMTKLNLVMLNHSSEFDEIQQT